MIERVTTFVRKIGREAALTAWAGRHVQGAVARAVRNREVAGAALRLGRFRGAVEERFLPQTDWIGPPGQAFCPDRVLWRIRNYSGGGMEVRPKRKLR